MTRAPASLIAELQSAVRAERDAHAALVAAKAEHRHAMARTTASVGELRATGLSMTSIARVFAHEFNVAPSVAIRKRIAAKLRQRAVRHAVTARHADLLTPTPPSHPVHLGCSEPMPPGGESSNETEKQMSRLVKRTTTTEEFIEQDAAPKKKQLIRGTTTAPDEELEDGDEFADVGDEEDDEQPRVVRRRK